MSRADDIQERFDRQFRQTMGLAVAFPPRAEWETYPLGPQYQSGWLPPVPFAGEPRLLISFCPEIIAEQTEVLADIAAENDDVTEDELLEVYLSTIEFMLGRYIEWFDQQIPRAEITRRIEEDMYDHIPEAMQLLNEVQLQALDRKADD